MTDPKTPEQVEEQIEEQVEQGTAAPLPEQPETEADTGGHPIHGRDEALYEPAYGREPSGEVTELPDREDPPESEPEQPA